MACNVTKAVHANPDQTSILLYRSGSEENVCCFLILLKGASFSNGVQAHMFGRFHFELHMIDGHMIEHLPVVVASTNFGFPKITS
jgi:hypothetical protein